MVGGTKAQRSGHGREVCSTIGNHFCRSRPLPGETSGLHHRSTLPQVALSNVVNFAFLEVPPWTLCSALLRCFAFFPSSVTRTLKNHEMVPVILLTSQDPASILAMSMVEVPVIHDLSGNGVLTCSLGLFQSRWFACNVRLELVQGENVPTSRAHVLSKRLLRPNFTLVVQYNREKIK